MNEIGKYGVLKEKLQGICNENDLTFAIHNKKYPFFMTIKALSGVDGQMTMLEETDTGDTGYISPEAVIVFAYKDGDLTYKMSETINISDSLFNKIKNLFKKMYACYMAYYFRDRTENCCGDTDNLSCDEDLVPSVPENTADVPENAKDDTENDANVPDEPTSDTEDSVVVEPGEFADFFDETDLPTD